MNQKPSMIAKHARGHKYFNIALVLQDEWLIILTRPLKVYAISDSFTILGLWVLGLAVSNINESQLQIYESKTLF